jgi:hypothetical protein
MRRAVLRTAALPLGSSAAAATDGVRERASAKERLLSAIRRFEAAKSATESDGVPVDFGVKGGELDAQTGNPLNLVSKLRAISPDLADAANEVLLAIESLAPLSPIPDPTRFLGTAEGALCPLHGPWCLQFTTAADATFSKNSSRGGATTRQFVDAVSGTIVNQIDFLKASSALQQLRVVIRASARSPTRVDLNFRYGVAHLRRFLGLPIRTKLFIPLSVLFAIAGAVRALARRLRGAREPLPQPPHFEVLYLDHEMRCHRTGEGNVFVQLRPAALG